MDFLELKSGSSVEGTEIKAYRSGKKAKTYTYLMAGVHGDEVEGVYVVKSMFTWLQENDDINEDLPLIVIPILNVDGYRAGTRINANGVDLNRNFPSQYWTPKARASKYNPGKAPLSEPENQFLVKLFDKYPPKLILTIHSWKPMLNINGEDCEKYANFIKQYNDYPVVPDIEGHPTPGSLGEYGPEKYEAQVLTYELPVISEENSLKQIWENNSEGLKKLFTSNLI